MAGISYEDTSAEWRSSGQVENCTPSTSPTYWDSDEDDGGRPRPSELYGKHTWKIEKYSQITKRELRSNVFEAGGYKWYILIYPQGCDVSNHLSLFLCVANHEKLLPGWSHFAQFTIAVVNKDPKKSKYSDTLHRFWKKEHDWGWKKFMELSKLQDGFIEADTLIIRAQVQVIRERADRPFRCLDCQYRGELIRVYLTNVEQICRRFGEERRAKLRKCMEDRSRWSSFCAFWSSLDPDSRRCMSKEKMEPILKVIVKHFFIEKEVTSTLVMDSMYSGLKALENEEKGKNNNPTNSQTEDFTFILIEKDSFILVDDALHLLQTAALVSLPPKDEKGPQNRLKDGAAGDDFNKNFIERDERRLTDLGRQTLEIFVLGKIISKIEAAYQEDVAFKKQEELIREEEEAWLAKKRRGDKEKKYKKKQGKQKHRKGKDKTTYKTEKNRTGESEATFEAEPKSIRVTLDAYDNVSEVSDSVDRDHETLPPDSEGREASPASWETDTSGINGLSDNASSTHSSVSVPSPLTTSSHLYNSVKSPNRLKNHRREFSPDTSEWVSKDPADKQSEHTVVVEARDGISTATSGSATDGPWSHVASRSLQDKGVKKLEHNVDDKVETCPSRINSKKSTLSHAESPKEANPPSPVRSPSKSTRSTIVQPKLAVKVNTTSSPPNTGNKPSILEISSQPPAEFKSEPNSMPTPKPNENPSGPQSPVVRPEKLQTPRHPPVIISKPLSAPSVPVPKPASVSVVQPPRPSLSRSVSVVGPLGLERTAPASHSYGPQSYRHATAGGSVLPSSTTYSQNYASTGFPMHSLAPSSHISPAPMLQSRSSWLDWAQRDNRSQSLPSNVASVAIDEAQRLDSYNQVSTSGLAYDFPHLDIINDLLDDEHGVGGVNGPTHLNRLNSFPSDPGLNPRTKSYAWQSVYGSSVSSYDARAHRVDPQPYVNGYLSNQWRMSGVDSSSFAGFRGVENDGYTYNGVDESLTGANPYEVVRPTDGLQSSFITK